VKESANSWPGFAIGENELEIDVLGQPL
jgi:hypothetical protein